MKRAHLLLISLFLFLLIEAYALYSVPKVYPSATQIVQNSEEYQNQVLYLRGFYVSSSQPPTLETSGVFYQARGLPSFEKGDVIDMKIESHLSEGYVEVLDYHHRPRSKHLSMFYTSIPAIFIVLFFLWRDRKIFRWFDE